MAALHDGARVRVTLAADSAAVGQPAEEFGEAISWSTEEVVGLHFILLDDLGRLADSRTPLEEKFELLEWVFTDPEKEGRPFSFRACVRLYQRTCDPELARDMLRRLVSEWLRESLATLPAWLAERILREPQWAASHLHRNPQWINEELRRQGREPDLFSMP